MNRFAWILYVARRYFRSKRRERGMAPSLLSVTGIAVGVMTLISVLAVMNGFQLGFIESILAIGSYHLRVATDDGAPLSAAQLATLRSLPDVAAVVPFTEVQTMVSAAGSPMQGALVRGLPPSVASDDPDFARHLRIVAGELSLGGERTVVIGSELAQALDVGPGDLLSMVSLSGRNFGSLTPSGIDFTVSGIFKSGYLDFDQSLCLVSEASARELGAADASMLYGVKLVDRFRDRQAETRIFGALHGRPITITSWRQINSAFFGALKTEKLTMSLLLGLIFLVVAFNIYQSLRRAVFERREEIAVLRSLGASPRSMRAVFIWDGVYIGGFGATAGLCLGLLVAGHINELFTLVEAAVNGFQDAIAAVAAPFTSHPGAFSLFSPTVFYIDAVPSRVLFPETLVVFLFAALSSVTAAFAASRRVSEIKPADVLHYE